jgi:hypothetical protein
MGGEALRQAAEAPAPNGRGAKRAFMPTFLQGLPIAVLSLFNG